MQCFTENLETVSLIRIRKNSCAMAVEQNNTPLNPYLTSGSQSSTFHSAGFPAYSSNSMGSAYPGYSSYSSLPGLGGYGNAYGYGYNSMFPGDNLWQGFLGQTAETLGRFNNLLSMTGMLVEHISNHGKLLYNKGSELHTWYQNLRHIGTKHSEWLERLGFHLESGWNTSEHEDVRRRRMMVRRTRTFLILAFIIIILLSTRAKQKRKRFQGWDSVYQGSHAPNHSRFNQ
jgi:hypothetical protein